MHIVTGGAGFIGSNIVKALKKKHLEVIVVDDLDHKLKHEYLTNLKVDKIISPSSLEKFITNNHKKILSVIHMGAITSTAELNIKLLLKNNLFFSSMIFNICNKYSIKFIYASSAATYGNGKNGFNDSNFLIDFIKLQPINYYGLTKHLFDLEILQKIESGIKIESRPVGLKFFNVYGPNELHKGFMMSTIPKFYNQIKINKYMNLFKSHNPQFLNGMQSRDFIYVKDCVDVTLWFLKRKEKQGIFNVGTGKSETFLNLSKIIFKNLSLDMDIRFIDTPKKIRNGYQYYTKANISQIRKVGFSKNFTRLKDGVNEYINLYLS